MTRRSRLFGQASLGWGAIDQGLSSGTNFILTLVVVRSVDIAEFGTFSLVYLLYILMLPIARATGTSPFTIRNAKGARDRTEGARRATVASLRYAFALGLVALLVCFGLAAVAGPSARSSFLVLGLCFPLLLVQDAVRGVFFVRSEYIRATANDGVWALALFAVLIPLLLLVDGPPVVAFVAAWAGAGALAGVFGLVQLKVRIRPVWPTVWLKQNADLARPLFLSTVCTVLPAQLTYLLMPVVSSVTELGSVRAAYVLFGVLNVAYTTVMMLALPYASRFEPVRCRRFAAWLSVGMGALAVVWGGLILLIPAALGSELIGDAWDETGTVRVLLALSLIAEGVTVGPTVALAALRMPERMARVRYVTAPLTLVLGLALAARWGAVGVSLGFVIGYSATAVLGWLQMPSTASLVGLTHDDEPDTVDDAAGRANDG